MSDGSISHFDRDPISKTLYVVNGEACIQRRRPDPLFPIPRKHEDNEELPSLLNAYTFEPWDILARMTSPVSSLNYLPASGALCVTTCGSDRSPVVYLTDPDRDGPYLGEMYTPRHCTTIWDSAPRPLSFSSLPSTNSIPATATECIAVGVSSALMLFTRANSGAWQTKTMPNLASDIFALEWLSENTLALGCRNGKIHLYDTRANGESHILTHPFPISQLRRGDDFTRLVCSGLQNTCVLYDMRMARPQSGAQQPSSSSQSTHNNNNNNNSYTRNRKRKRPPYHIPPSTQPILHFRHSNPDDLELGLDVHPGLGLVAAAQDDASIRISNLWTGKTVREFDAGDDGMAGEMLGNWKKKAGRIRCLRFMNDGDGDGDVGLWSSCGAGLRRFAW